MVSDFSENVERSPDKSIRCAPIPKINRSFRYVQVTWVDGGHPNR
jgi:hypothetical protein